ncbi:MAG: HDOD domain-containing protein [bacterium]|nr:HDOD domain-containing protein [bacterium]
MSITEEIIREIQYFPQQPGSGHRLLGQLDRPGITVPGVLEILEYDIAVTANILKLCNSPAYARQLPVEGKISSLKEAVQVIHLEELKKMIAMSASTDIFSRSGGIGYEMGKGEIRRHSIAAAVISKHLLSFAPPMTGDLFTACLLHDTGKMIMAQHIADHQEDLLRAVDVEGCDFAEAEKRVLGMTHAEAGARVLEKWRFPPEMVTAVRFHHEPETVPGSPLTHFVSLADTISMMMGFATGLDAMEYKGFPALYKTYKIKEKDIELILMNALDEVNAVIPFERRKQEGNTDRRANPRGKQDRRQENEEIWR